MVVTACASRGGEFEPGDFQVRLQVAFHPLAVDLLQVPGPAGRRCDRADCQPGKPGLRYALVQAAQIASYKDEAIRSYFT